MKYQALCGIGLLALVSLAGCDASKKAPAAHDDMAGMEMPAAAPVAASGPVVKVGDISVSGAWAPVTPMGARVAAGYFTIKNAGASADKLLSVSSARAKSAELHEMLDEKGMMTMRQVKQLALKPGQEVTLAPGTLHLMFLEPALPYADGEMLPVTLTFEKAGKVEVQLLVRQREIGADEQSSH